MPRGRQQLDKKQGAALEKTAGAKDRSDRQNRGKTVKIKVNVSKPKRVKPEDVLPESREFFDQPPAMPVMTPPLEQRELMAESKPKDSDKIARDKKLIMWSGVIFFMVLIAAVWLFNIKNIFYVDKSKTSAGRFDWSKLGAELGESLSSAKEKLEQMQKISQILAKATSTQETAVLKPEQVETLKENLLKQAGENTAAKSTRTEY